MLTKKLKKKLTLLQYLKSIDIKDGDRQWLVHWVNQSIDSVC